jgi:hypothetical protein
VQTDKEIDKTNEVEPPICMRCGRRHFSKYTEARCALKLMLGLPVRPEAVRTPVSSPSATPTRIVLRFHQTANTEPQTESNGTK